MSFVNSYSGHFESHRHDVSGKAHQYACGLMQAGSRKNMDRMAEVVPESKSRNLQQFLTHSKWEARAVMDHVARDADALLGDEENACLLIDETSFKKQGRKSVGTARQWLGRQGKVDNGQVAVFGALANDRLAVPVDERLYLPKEWTDDPERCREAGIPESEQTFRTKDELALEIVAHARRNGLRFGWVGADAGYGKGPGFFSALDRMGETFLIDVHSDLHVYLEDPEPFIPERTSGKGRRFTKYRTNAESVEIRKIADEKTLAGQPVLKLRGTSRGTQRVRAFSLPVFVWERGTPRAERWTLVVTRTLGPNPDTKYSLTNAPGDTDLRTLAGRQRQRYWVERVFQDAKSECGMADYQVRKWNAFHHHMALVMMAMMFMLGERIRHKDTCPLLSCADIEELLSHFLPRRRMTPQAVIRRMEHRHRKRQAAMNSHARTSEANAPPDRT